jgi:hypothetical protein
VVVLLGKAVRVMGHGGCGSLVSPYDSLWNRRRRRRREAGWLVVKWSVAKDVLYSRPYIIRGFELWL